MNIDEMKAGQQEEGSTRGLMIAVAIIVMLVLAAVAVNMFTPADNNTSVRYYENPDVTTALPSFETDAEDEERNRQLRREADAVASKAISDALEKRKVPNNVISVSPDEDTASDIIQAYSGSGDAVLKWQNRYNEEKARGLKMRAEAEVAIAKAEMQVQIVKAEMMGELMRLEERLKAEIYKTQLLEKQNADLLDRLEKK